MITASSIEGVAFTVMAVVPRPSVYWYLAIGLLGGISVAGAV